MLSRNVVEVQKEVRLQQSTESCANQEKELVKVESDYQSVYQLCEDQAHYIKEKTIIKKQKRIFWYRHFKYLVFMVMIFIRLLGYMLFYLQYINPDLLVDALPMVMSRDALKRLRDVLFPFLTLEVEEVLPH
ncbi:transmembrane and coiled-coil domain-containing protein 5B-like protein [Camelus ferus]|nr:transmembrane and coiled-coil domain-containing protein 5B-like protein [Camelus ferus]